MEERDYLMRQFNQFARAMGKILAELLKLKDQGNTPVTIATVQQQLKTNLNLTIEDIVNIPAGHFIQKFIDDFDADYSGFEDLANLLYQVAHLFEAQNEMEKAVPLYHRALLVYQYLTNTGNTFSFEVHLRIGELRNILEN